MTGEQRHKLWYRREASCWEEALPVGNGSLGGMIYGGVHFNRIQLNEDTLFSGPREIRPGDPLLPFLPEVRRLVSSRRYAEAQKIIESLSPGAGGASYLPLAELSLRPEYRDREGIGEDSYLRELDLSEGIYRESCRIGGRDYVQECFCSFPDQVLVYRYYEKEGSPVNLRCSLSSPLCHTCAMEKGGLIKLSGTTPASVIPPSESSDDPVVYKQEGGMGFCLFAEVLNEGGSRENYGSEIVVRGAVSVTIIISAATGYIGFGKALREDPGKPAREILAGAERRTYHELRKRHIDDHGTLYGRVDFHLGTPEQDEVPTDRRLENVSSGIEDKTLVTLFYHYSRYLLISSSRPGSQPANLQGIWNNSARPPWTGNLTTNINVQMNYWNAEPGNLSECHEPLLAAVEEASRTGAETSERLYGCRGWCVHHGLDLWRRAGPSGGNAAWSFWPMAGPWLCQHLWDHYEYSRNREFLEERAYPLMRGAALFCLDWLTEDKEGNLVTNPSTSPENSFVTDEGRTAAVSQASTMDMSLIWQLFTHTIDASRILNRDESLRTSLAEARSRLFPLKIGRRGQRQEWFEDFDEADPGHRHTAHLYALHPGNRIEPKRDEALGQACLRTLELRIEHEGPDTVGWCFAWYICLFARLGQGDRAREYLRKLLANPFPNLLNAHRHPKITFYPMTIEANFGGAAGITELLLQSHRGCLDLLPALPADWPNGKITGLKARGRFRVDISWQEGRLAEAVVLSEKGEPCYICGRDSLAVYDPMEREIPAEQRPEGLAFPTEINQTYYIRRRK